MPSAAWLHSGEQDDDREAPGRPDPTSAADIAELPYHVEVWDERGAAPEILVAITITASLAYAAFYAAAREFSGRDVTLKFKGMTLSHWRGRLN